MSSISNIHSLYSNSFVFPPNAYLVLGRTRSLFSSCPPSVSVLLHSTVPFQSVHLSPVPTLVDVDEIKHLSRVPSQMDEISTLFYKIY